MKKIFTFKENVMNGTVTMSSRGVAFATRELAEKARQAVIAANRDNEPGMVMRPSEVEETTVFESEDEVYILSGKNKIEDREWPSGMGDIYIGTPQAIDEFIRRKAEGTLLIKDRNPLYDTLTAEVWTPLDYETTERTFRIVCPEDTPRWERGILHDVVRQCSGLLTYEKFVDYITGEDSADVLRFGTLTELADVLVQTWVHRMPPMTFADHRPHVVIDYREYAKDREHGQIVVTFSTEFLH